MMRVVTHKLLLSKPGAPVAECEDAIDGDDQARRYAIADGATEAFDARGWATHLARAWTSARRLPRTPAEFVAWAQGEGAAWGETWQGRSLPWFAEEKRRAGSFAAFVGIEFEEEGEALRWRACAIGDSVLLRVRAGRLAGAMPIADFTKFDSTPRLVPSVAARERLNESDVRVEAGAVESGEVFWLLSDAIAAWCLRSFAEQSERMSQFERLLIVEDVAALSRLVDDERRAGSLRDDDVAALRIELQL